MKIEIKWKPNAKNKIIKINPRNIVHDIAQETFKMSYPIIPCDTGRMRDTSLRMGVFECTPKYDFAFGIGSFTDYASKVWNYNPFATHWTTPGTTSRWYEEGFVRNYKLIITKSIERNMQNDNR